MTKSRPGNLAKPERRRPNSIVEAAYSAAMFSDRRDKKLEAEKSAEEALQAG